MIAHTYKPAALGKDIAFGLQQTLACWATDFIDPVLGGKIQEHFEDAHHKGVRGGTWIGEIVGDTSAFFVFLGVERWAPQPVGWLKATARNCFDPLYEWLGKKHLHKEHVDENAPDYRNRLDAWKEFQADNFAKSSVITISSVALNVATQKALGNTHKLWVITASKIAGAAVTMAGMLGLRFALPKTTHQLDDELNEHYFSPLIRKTQTLMGAGPEPEAGAAYAEKIKHDRDQSQERAYGTYF